MHLPKRHNTIVINFLLAVAVSLVINFSYLLAVRQNYYQTLLEDPLQTLHEGTLRISKDGYGYIVCQDHSRGEGTQSDSLATDSIYVSMRDALRLKLSDGDRMTVIPRTSRLEGGNPVLAVVKEVNGVPFDYRAVYNRPADNILFGLQFGYFFVLALVLLSIMTTGARGDTSWKFFLKRGSIAVAVAVLFFFVMPVEKFRSDDIILNFMNSHNGVPIVNPVAILKISFVAVLVLLYARTYQLIHQKEDIMLENEQLKSENLRARYNTLINQINPHFLFNSLNSLSSLVREGRSEDAVRYIDRLSDTFRYTIRKEPHTTTTLAEELEFVAAYKYLLEVRYDEKLFVDIAVEEDKLEWALPTFSIQPLIENAVKHNTITRACPLRISIRTEGDRLIVSNPINPKLEPETGTGIGLENLSKRSLMMTGRNIEITDDGKTFSVEIPFYKTV